MTTESMPSPTAVDHALIERWTRQAGQECYLCGTCNGLHLADLQTLDGVIDARLFLEPEGVLFTTELELRPMAVLPAAADLGRLSLQYPTLKLFLDILDDSVPRLVASDTLLTGAGATFEQMHYFLTITAEATRSLVAECLELDLLFLDEPGADTDGGASADHRPLH